MSGLVKLPLAVVPKFVLQILNVLLSLMGLPGVSLTHTIINVLSQTFIPRAFASSDAVLHTGVVFLGQIQKGIKLSAEGKDP
jgi:hypothetical protein